MQQEHWNDTIEGQHHNGAGRRPDGPADDQGAPDVPTRSVPKGSDGPTYDELYNEAKERGVKGRSRMNKMELARAVGR